MYVLNILSIGSFSLVLNVLSNMPITTLLEFIVFFICSSNNRSLVANTPRSFTVFFIVIGSSDEDSYGYQFVPGNKVYDCRPPEGKWLYSTNHPDWSLLDQRLWRLAKDPWLYIINMYSGTEYLGNLQSYNKRHMTKWEVTESRQLSIV